MDQQLINKTNELIAKFMEWKTGMSWLDDGEFETPHSQQKWIESGISCGWESVKDFTPEEMLFNSSWDWLMPVVEKINTLYVTDGEEFTSPLLIADIHKYVANVKIEEAFKAVIAYIKFWTVRQ